MTSTSAAAPEADDTPLAEHAVRSAGNDEMKSPYRWVILALCTFVMTTSFIVRFAWSTAAAEVSNDMGFNATTLGSFVTAFFCGYVITNAVSGFLTDRFGPKFMILAGTIPLATLVATFGMMNNVPMGLAIQFGIGLTAGVNYSACMKLAASWFGSNERGLAFGVLSVASSVAVITSNSFFPHLIELTSWRVLYYCLGGEVLLMALISLIGLRNSPFAAENRGSPEREPFFRTVREFVGNRNYRILAVVEFSGLWATWGVIFWANALMVKGYGLSNVAAGQVAATIGIGGFIAKPLYGWLSDVLPVKRKTMLVPALLGLSAALLIFGNLKSEGAFRIMAPLLGVFAFGFTPLMAAILSEIIPKERIGAGAGVMNSLVQFSAVLGPLAVGIIFDYTASFFAAFACLACGPLIAAGAALMIDEPKGEPREHD